MRDKSDDGSCGKIIPVEDGDTAGNLLSFPSNVSLIIAKPKPSQSSNWGAEACAKRKSTSPCLLAIPAFDRKAGLDDRHVNSNRGICLR